MEKYALVIGISKYEDPEITDLSFAAKGFRVAKTVYWPQDRSR